MTSDNNGPDRRYDLHDKIIELDKAKAKIERLEKENINLSDQCLDLEMQLLSVNQTLDAWKTENQSQKQIIDTLKGALLEIAYSGCESGWAIETADQALNQVAEMEKPS